MKKSILLLGACGVLPLAAWLAPADEVSFHPSEGTSLTKVFTTEAEMSLDNMSLAINGQPPPMDLGDMEMTIVENRSVSITDEYVSMGEGRPNKLKRSYDEIAGTTDISFDMPMMGNTTERSVESASDLQGMTVAFTWDADEGGFTPAFVEDEGDEELLEGLAEDMDLRFLLPESGKAAAGDTWEVDADELRGLIAPGGKLSLVPEESDDDDGGMGFGNMGSGPQDPSDYLGDMDGGANCEFASTREVDGVMVAVIKIEIEVSTASDMTDKVLEQMEDADLPEGVGNMEFDHMDIELEIESEGTLLWNLEAGHIHSLELTGTQTMLMDMGMSMEPEGMGTMDLEQSFEMSGNFTLSVSTE